MDLRHAFIFSCQCKMALAKNYQALFKNGEADWLQSNRRIHPTASSQRHSRSRISLMPICGKDGARQPAPTPTVVGRS